MLKGYYQNKQKIVGYRDELFGVVENDERIGTELRQVPVYEDDGKEFVPYTETELDSIYKQERSKYLDAYRKYQAAVNYGEFQRVPAADYFIRRLRNRDWAAFDNIPAALKYFAGECSFAQSGLIENPM
jgi:hypothetical protein